MKAKRLSLALAALLALGGWWLARSVRRTQSEDHSNAAAGLNAPPDSSKPSPMLKAPARLAPPDPTRRFRDFTPEQRVEFARKGHGPGG